MMCRVLAPAPKVTDAATPSDVWVPKVKQDSYVEEKVVATRPRSTGTLNRPGIANVEVDPAGCSYNPEYEQHQNALALAVANEVDQHIARALEPVVRSHSGMHAIVPPHSPVPGMLSRLQAGLSLWRYKHRLGSLGDAFVTGCGPWSTGRCAGPWLRTLTSACRPRLQARRMF